MKVTDNQLFYAMPDCSSFSDEDKREYHKQISDALDIPVALPLLDYIWLDNADGTRKLVLYVKKGGTDHLRTKHGISIVEMKEALIADCIVYTAKAQAKDGRTDIAAGACCIRGLNPKKLGDAFAIAQTRASRRVTLSILGVGLLDESEIKEMNDEAPIGQTPAGLVTAVNQPMPLINNAPAQEVKIIEGVKVPFTMPLTQEAIRKLCEERLPPFKVSPMPAVEAVEAKTTEAPVPTVADTQPSLEEPKRRRRRSKAEMVASEAAIQLNLFDDAAAAETSVTPAQKAAQDALNAIVSTELDKLDRHNVDPGPTMCPECKSSFGVHVITCSVAVGGTISSIGAASVSGPRSSVGAASVVNHESLEELAKAVAALSASSPAIASPAVNAGAPTPDDLKEYKSKLANYQNNILTRNGGTMGPDEELGSVSNQIKLFFCKRAGIASATDWVKQTKTQWEETFKFMDDTMANSGVKVLITAISEAIRA